VLNYLSIRPWRLTGIGNISPPFLTSALDGGEWSASRPCLFNPQKNLQYPLDRILGGPQIPSGRCGAEKNILHLPGNEPGRPAHRISNVITARTHMRTFLGLNRKWKVTGGKLTVTSQGNVIHCVCWIVLRLFNDAVWTAEVTVE
jgi:hypothetical protein